MPSRPRGGFLPCSRWSRRRRWRTVADQADSHSGPSCPGVSPIVTRIFRTARRSARPTDHRLDRPGCSGFLGTEIAPRSTGRYTFADVVDTKRSSRRRWKRVRTILRELRPDHAARARLAPCLAHRRCLRQPEGADRLREAESRHRLCVARSAPAALAANDQAHASLHDAHPVKGGGHASATSCGTSNLGVPACSGASAVKPAS